jgi:cell wall-associated NlpC family hydrolase
VTPARSSAAGLAGLLLGGLLVVGHPAAQADPMGDAQHRAATLRTQVQALQQQAELATEVYDEAYAKLGAAVTAHLTAERDLAAAQQTAGTSNDLAGRRVRALYMAGGTAGLYAQVLDSASITEVAQRVHQVGIVLADDGRTSQLADHAVALRADAAQRLAASAATATALQKVVSTKADAVRALLDQADALLASADQQVRDLAAAQQRQADAVSAVQDAQTLAAARAAAGNIPEVAPNAQAQTALAFAQSQLGKPYVWGATGPDSYDCSGLTGAAYRAAGIALPRTSREQWFSGPHVELGALLPGDLLFWSFDPADPSLIHHVAIYAGHGMMYAAPHTGDVVRYQPVFLDGYIGAVRPSVSG